jgi:hypothetical protein
LLFTARVLARSTFERASPLKLASPDEDEESDEDPHPTRSAPTATATASSGNLQNLDGIDIPHPL